MTTETPTPEQVREALAALGTDLGDLPSPATRADWPELIGRLLGSAYALLRREDLPEDLDVGTENARITAAYQTVMEPLGDPRTVAFESAFAALRHFRLVIGSLEPDDPLSAATAQLMQVTAMACGVAFLSPNQLLLSPEERIATGETLQEEIDTTFASLRVLERTAKKLIRS